jgi:hypothetical protein
MVHTFSPADVSFARCCPVEAITVNAVATRDRVGDELAQLA